MGPDEKERVKYFSLSLSSSSLATSPVSLRVALLDGFFLGGGGGPELGSSYQASIWIQVCKIQNPTLMPAISNDKPNNKPFRVALQAHISDLRTSFVVTIRIKLIKVMTPCVL